LNIEKEHFETFVYDWGRFIAYPYHDMDYHALGEKILHHSSPGQLHNIYCIINNRNPSKA